MRYFITGRPQFYDPEELAKEEIELVDLTKVKEIIGDTKSFQLDVETTMVGDVPKQHELRELKVLQLGDMRSKNQLVFDIPELPPEVIKFLKDLLSSKSVAVIGHNILFEYLVLKSQLGIILNSVHDTYILAKLLTIGKDLPKGYNGLAAIMSRLFHIELEKDSQTTFDGSPLSAKQIVYAANDVRYLNKIFKIYHPKIKDLKMLKVYNLERESLKAYGDMQLNYMKFDRNHWDLVIKANEKELSRLTKELNQEVLSDDSLVQVLKKFKVGKEYLICPQDTYNINWRSSTFRKDVLPVLFPSLPTNLQKKPDITKFFKKNKENLPEDEMFYLEQFVNGDYDQLETLLVTQHNDFLESKGYFIPKDTLNINWASQAHKLKIFRHYYPSLEDTNQKSLDRIKVNSLINKFKEFSKVQKNYTTYGQSFLDNNVSDDDLVAPMKLNQILTTGRVSFGILLQMPGKNLYRNAFLPREGRVFVDTDYSSMEVLIMAYRAGEQAFINAALERKDLHSMSAVEIYGDEWHDAAEPDCEFAKTGSRCDCPKHDRLRKFSKAVTFGLAYGLTHMGLSDRLKITKTEGLELMEKYFKTFPKIHAMLEQDGKFGVENGYIEGMAPLYRKRFFDPPRYKSDEGVIERASKNFPIQSANADVLKYALMLIRNYIIEHNLDVELHLPIHDEILSSCPKEFAETWKQKQEELMIEAAGLYLDKNMVTVDSQILDKWAKG